MNAGTITLLIYIVVLVPLMLLGFYFARRKMFKPHHQLVMTSVVILNWVLIGVVMFNSYAPIAANLPNDLDQPFAIVPTIHGIIGLIAQLMASYLVLLMWTENTPIHWIVGYRIKSIKTPMRITLSLWLITVLLGFAVYGVWYGGDTAADSEGVIEPASTEEADAQGVPDPDATEEAVPEPDATEEAAPAPDTTEEALSDDAIDATEDAADDATDAAEDAARETEDAAEDATDAAEDAADDDD